MYASEEPGQACSCQTPGKRTANIKSVPLPKYRSKYFKDEETAQSLPQTTNITAHYLAGLLILYYAPHALDASVFSATAASLSFSSSFKDAAKSAPCSSGFDTSCSAYTMKNCQQEIAKLDKLSNKNEASEGLCCRRQRLVVTITSMQYQITTQ